MREISPARLPLDGKLIRFENHLFASEPCAARDFDRIALATRYSPHDASTVSPVVRNKKSGGQAPAFPFPFGTCRESIPPMRILQQCFRVYAEEIEAAVRFYEGLQGVACERRVKIPETSVEAAKVGRFLILAGDKARLDPVRHVDAIFYVDSLDEFADWLSSHGASVIDGPRSVTAGRNLTARHADGLVVEYFEAGARSPLSRSEVYDPHSGSRAHSISRLRAWV